MKFDVTLIIDKPGIALNLGGGDLMVRTSTSLHGYWVEAQDHDDAYRVAKEQHAAKYPDERVLGTKRNERHVYYEATFRSKADGRKRHVVSVLVPEETLRDYTTSRRKRERLTVEEYVARRVRSYSSIDWETKRDLGEILKAEISSVQ
jgi:hypothetical protein